MPRSSGALFQWIDDPPDRRAIHVASSAWVWESFTYRDVAARTRAAAAGLHRLGVAPHAAVAIVLPPGPSFIAALFGVMCSGATPLVIAPPRLFGPGAYAAHLAHVTTAADASLIVTSEDLAASLAADAPGLTAPIRTIEAIVEAGRGLDRPDVPLADLALLQFTSGTHGLSRGVRVPYAALEANVAAIRAWLGWTTDDAAAFWTPLYHDMGLIGGLFAPLASRCDLWYLTPEQFVRRPLEYLRTFGRHGVRFTAIPAFGLDHLARRVRPADLDDCDFSAVKGIIVGAELIAPETLARVERLLGPRGLRSGVLLPAYGLAEATLAVSGVAPGEAWTCATPPGGGPPLVGCGRALPDVSIAIDTAVDAAPDASIDAAPDTPAAGEIVVRGPSIASGYVEAVAGISGSGSGSGGAATSAVVTGTRWIDDALHTGDAGFLRDGQLFPMGRQGDSIKIRGQALFADWVEREIEAHGRPRSHNTVLLGMLRGRPAVVWIAEGRAADDDRDVRRTLRRLAEEAAVLQVRAPRGTITRTSSGKPRRRQLWNDFVNDRLPGLVYRDSREEEFDDGDRRTERSW